MRGRVEHLLCKVDVGQWPLKHDRDAGGARATHLRQFFARRLDPSRHRPQFLLAVAAREIERAILIRRYEEARGRSRRLDPHLIDARQEIVQTLVVPTRQQGLRRDDVDLGHRGHSREQIEIYQPQPVARHRLIGHGHDEVRERWSPCLGEQTLAKSMLVQAAGCLDAPFEPGERLDQKPCLLQHPRCTMVDAGDRLQLADHQSLEVVQASLLTTQDVVKREHFGNQARSRRERRSDAVGFRGSSRLGQEQLTICRRQHRRYGRQPLMHAAVPVLAGQ